MAFGMLGFTKDQIDKAKLEKEEAKSRYRSSESKECARDTLGRHV